MHRLGIDRHRLCPFSFVAIVSPVAFLAVALLQGCARSYHPHERDELSRLIESSERYQSLELADVEYSLVARISDVLRGRPRYRYSIDGELERLIDYRILGEIISRMGLLDRVYLAVTVKESEPVPRCRDAHRGIEKALDCLVELLEANGRYAMLDIERIEYPGKLQSRRRAKSELEYPLWDYLVMGTVASSEDLRCLLEAIHVGGLEGRVGLEVIVKADAGSP